MNEPAPRLLLDTCAAIWISTGSDIDSGARDAVGQIEDAGETLYISAITAWEVALLLRRNRLSLAVPVETWFATIAALPQVNIAELSPLVLIRSVALPGSPPPDPADRMIIATAREHGLTIVTRDRRILDYAETGHVAAMPC